jgi:hypothetical protein
VRYTALTQTLRDLGFAGDASKSYPWPTHTAPTVLIEHANGGREFVAECVSFDRTDTL